jgi:hypothetical protein
MMTQNAGTVMPMPEGLLDGPSVWRGRDFAGSDSWIRRFSDAEVAEIDSAMRACRRRGMPVLDIRPENFPLPSLGPELGRVRDDIVHGRGFTFLRGLPVADWTEAEAATAYWGIGTHVGRILSQNVRGHMLDHVRDTGQSMADGNVRAYQTAIHMSYHTDMSCDVVGLLCLQAARAGGRSTVVSGATLYNEIYRRDPGLCAELFGTFWFDRRAEIPPGKKGYFPVSLFNWHAGVFTVMYSPIYIDSAQSRFPDVPRLTGRQKAALDLLETVAADPDVHLAMDFRPGDIQFLNNFTVMHARTAFEDGDGPAQQRHLLRMWLCVDDGIPIPEGFSERYGTVTIGARGGITKAGVLPSVPIDGI